MQNQKKSYELKVQVSWDATRLEGSVIPLGQPQMSLTHRGWIVIHHFKQTQGTVLIIKPMRCTNFSNLFLEYNSTCFRQFLCPSSGV